MSFWIARYFGRCHFFYSTSRNYVINDNEKKHASTIDSNDYNLIKNGENLAVAFHKTRSFVVACLSVSVFLWNWETHRVLYTVFCIKVRVLRLLKFSLRKKSNRDKQTTKPLIFYGKNFGTALSLENCQLKSCGHLSTSSFEAT